MIQDIDTFDSFPHLDKINMEFEKHREQYSNLCSQIISRDFRSEETLIREYSGRVLFELFQNALDRSFSRIWIWLDKEKHRLVIANDGRPVSVFPYPDIRNSANPPSDFHALLSLHDSTKSADQSIGNKGVGFRSVFSASQTVDIWSRSASSHNSSTWWGLRLSHPVHGDCEKLASFYRPEPLGALAKSCDVPEPLDQSSDFVTAIILNNLFQGKIDDIEEGIEQFLILPTIFLDQRLPIRSSGKIMLHIGDRNATPRQIGDSEGWMHFDLGEISLNEDTRKETGLDLETAKVRVALANECSSGPLADSNARRWERSVFWSYLPTEELAGFGFQIHADFYLSNSRRNVTFYDGELKETDPSPQAHNLRLLRHAAHNIVDKVWTEPQVAQRRDFWLLWNPSCCFSKMLEREVANHLFVEKQFCEIFAAGFAGNYESAIAVERFDEAMTALRAWGDRLCRSKSDRDKWWREKLGWLRKVKIAMVPVAGSDSLQVLPPEPERNKPVTYKLFYRSEESDFSLPEPLARNGRFVTIINSQQTGGFSIDKDLFFREFNRIEIIADLEPGKTTEEHETTSTVALLRRIDALSR